jgi:hypothetical protein
MTTTDALISQYHALKPVDFGYLECLELKQSVQPEDCTGITLKLQLRRLGGGGGNYLSLVFSGVRDLRIGNLVGLLYYLLETRSIRDRQLEQLNYEVSENEHSAFTFVCRSFTATVESD